MPELEYNISHDNDLIRLLPSYIFVEKSRTIWVIFGMKITDKFSLMKILRLVILIYDVNNITIYSAGPSFFIYYQHS